MMTENEFKYVVGKTLETAKGELPPKYFFFTAEEDGKSFYRSMDFNPYRINIIVKEGKVYRIQGIN